MLSDFSLFTLFLLGFFGGTHCIGMCGGLSSAFVLQLPPERNRFAMLLALNGGRIAGYTLIGGTLGALGGLGISLDQTRNLQNILFAAAHLLLLFSGLYLAGLSSWVRRIESIGVPVWKRLNPLLGRLLPVRTLYGGFAAGILWSWLPCGLIYSASLYALGSGGAIEGAILMAAFGAGTLPNLLAMGLFASQLKNVLQNRFIRLTAGLTIAAWAVWQLLRFGGISLF